MLEVDVLTPEEQVVTLSDGALIGRSPRCELQLLDPRISEVHSTISLRGRDARLLALRGRYAIDGKLTDDVVLQGGMEVLLARDLSLRILAVRLPETVLAIHLPDGRELIPSGVTSLLATSPWARRGWTSKAVAWVWSSEGVWFVDDVSGRQRLTPGEPIEVDGRSLPTSTVVARSFADTEHGELSAPLTIRCFHDAVQLESPGREMVVLSGNAARIVCELAACGCPLSWQELARSISGDAEAQTLRRRWDSQLYRLRATLRKANLNPDLVAADGNGLVYLVVRSVDTVIDAG
jgi:hypothetical protein